MRFFALITCLFIVFETQAVVKYDEGREEIDGIQLLQDAQDATAYYYIPPYPRLSTKEDGSFEFLCMKFVGQGGEETNGGIFHALIEYSLPPERVSAIEAKLKEKVGNKAKIVGPVPMQQAIEDGEKGMGSFTLVSAILSNTAGEGAFTKSVITSGHAPLLPGSKSAVAARLSQAGATLLWESMTGPTSDVSVTIRAYYEAAVRAYNATITAEVSTVYEHFSRLQNTQGGFTRDQMRKISDELIQTQLLNIEVFDRTKALGIEKNNLGPILDLITDKLVELMFDAENGWSKQPPREVAVEANQIQGRQDRGWFANTFLGADDTPYYSDNQFVLKKRSDIRINKFYLNLSQSTTIRVPIHTSGNLGGMYDALGKDDRYFKLVNLDDPGFQQRDIHFQIDGNFIESFNEILNFVSVSFRKIYGKSAEDVTRDIMFKRQDLSGGTDFKSVKYPRLGLEGSDWLDYEYKITWGLKGNDELIKFPADENKWLKAKSPVVALTPPFQKRTLEIDADRKLIKEQGYASATIRFMTVLAGKAQVQKTLIIRADDAENISKIALYHDANEPIAYQISWYAPSGVTKENLKELQGDYIALFPPVKSTANNK